MHTVPAVSFASSLVIVRRRLLMVQPIAYHIPNDQKEVERLNAQYEITKIFLDDRLYLSPLSDPRKIIDIATGTGRWAIEMADKFPHAQVIGTDLSPIQPVLVPPNLQFEIDDGFVAALISAHGSHEQQ